jgi:pimeloyl-ACP methyl ester carboxylesterase
MASPVIMVHGAFCGGWAFDAFKAPIEAAGHDCITPNLPGHAPGQSVVGLSMTDYARAIADQIRACETPPVLVGHSLGGLVAQMAACRAPVQSLILLAPSPPWGVTTGSMEEAAAGMGLLSLGAYWAQAVEPDDGISSAFSLDRLAKGERKAILARMIPESGRALWETFHWWLDPMMTTNVPFGHIKAPVLAIAGGRDCIHPPASVRQTAERLGADFRPYAEMSHWLINGPGSRDIAEDCVAWISARLKAAA